MNDSTPLDIATPPPERRRIPLWLRCIGGVMATMMIVAIGMVIWMVATLPPVTAPDLLPASWSPGCGEVAGEWQQFDESKRFHRQPKWLLGINEVAVRWDGQLSRQVGGQRIYEPISIIQTATGAAYPTPFSSASPTIAEPILNAGLTSQAIWYLGEDPIKDPQLMLIDRAKPKSAIRLKLPRQIAVTQGMRVPVRWIVRRYGQERLLLMGYTLKGSQSIAELRVIHLPDGAVESTTQIPLGDRWPFGDVDDESGTLILVEDALAPQCYELTVATGKIEQLPALPPGLARLNPLDRSPFVGIGTSSSYSQPTSGPRIYDMRDGLHYTIPDVWMTYEPDYTSTQGGSYVPPGNYQLNDELHAHPQEMFLSPNPRAAFFAHTQWPSMRWITVTTGPVGDFNEQLSEVDMQIVQSTIDHRAGFPLKLHPLRDGLVLVSQIIRPGTAAAGGPRGLIRLGRMNANTSRVTWLGWWQLPSRGFGGECGMDATFAFTGDTGWILASSYSMKMGWLGGETTSCVAMPIPDFDAWLDARLAEAETSPLVQNDPGH